MRNSLKDERDELEMFGHVWRRAINALVKKSELIQVEGMKRR